MTRHRLANSEIALTIDRKGAEMQSLTDADGGEYLWQAGPEWPRRAPNLFPIVGRLKGDRLLHRGQSYPMGQHGFARDLDFEWIAREAQHCHLRLRDNDETRARYPFAFHFDILYRLDGPAIHIAYRIVNTGDAVLPASVGAHPAFAWPLPSMAEKTGHWLEFDASVAGSARLLRDGLLTRETQPMPIENRLMPLEDSLFDRDALIFDPAPGSSVRYGAGRQSRIEVAWDAQFRQLGVWSRSHGDFLCIEPWRGHASPEDFDGDILDKPGMMLIAPGAQARLAWRITLL